MICKAVQVDLAAGTATGGDAAGDTLTEIENLIGSDHADVLTGDAAGNLLSGGRSDDTLVGGEGDDILIGGRGGDVMQGGAGRDTADYSLSVEGVAINMIDGASGSGDAQGDTFDSIEIIQGSYHDDTITGDDADNIMRGGLGADVMDAGAGHDILDYSREAEAIAINLGTGLGSAGAAMGDVVSGFEEVTGSNWNDTLTGSAGDETLAGCIGEDALSGGAGSDAYRFGFGDGSDVIIEAGDLAGLDAVLLAADVRPRDVSLVREGDDLLIELERTAGIVTDTLRVTSHFTGAEAGIEAIAFAKGPVWDAAQIDALTRLGRFNAGDDIYLFGTEDETVTFDVARLLENDATEGADLLEIIEVSAVSGGTPTLAPDGTLTFLGDLNFNGDAFFDYVVRDPFGRESVARVEVNLAPVNDAPEGTNDGIFYGTEDSPLFISYEDLLGNDTDIDGDSLSITDFEPLFDIDGNPLYVTPRFDLTNGKIEGTAGGYNFIPLDDHFGFAGFTYTLSDPDGLTATAKAELYFAPVNDAPRSRTDDITVRLGKVNYIAIGDYTADDYDIEGDAFDYLGFHSVTGGTATLIENDVPVVRDGRVFTGDYIEFVADALGYASFEYDLIDEHGAASTHTVDLEVIPLNDPPRARDDGGFETLEDQVLIIDPAALLANDSDPNGDEITVYSVERFPLNGKVDILENGTVQFRPRADYNGDAGFEYTITDGEYVSSAFVSINIIPSNDAPLVRDDVTSGIEDLPVVVIPGEIFGNDFDADGDVIFIDRIEVLGPVDGNYLVSAGEIVVDEDTLPDWLDYDAATGLLSGEMPEGFSGTLQIGITAEIGRWHGLAEAIIEANTIKVGGVDQVRLGTTTLITEILRLDDASTLWDDGLEITADMGDALREGFDLNAYLAPLVADRERNEFRLSLDLANGLKADVTADLILANGDAAPEWLLLNQDTLEITGDWPAGQIEALDLLVRLSYDTGAGGVLSHDIALTLAPEQAGDLAAAGVAAADDSPVLDLHTADITVTAASANGHPLPSWIDFDAERMELVLTGIAPDADESLLRMRVTFTPEFPAGVVLPDNFHLSADGSFALEFVIDPAAGLDPAINTMLQSQGFFAAQGLVALPQVDPALVTATKLSGYDLPDWLAFDAQTLTFAGTPPVDFVGGLPVRVDVASDGILPAFSIIHDLPVDRGFQTNGAGGITAVHDGEYIQVFRPEDFNGALAINYWATDEKDAVSEEPAVLVINIEPQPELPDPVADRFEGFEDVVLSLSLADLLANDVDDDGDPLRVILIEQPSEGTLTVNTPEQSIASALVLPVAAGAGVTATLANGDPLPDYITGVDAATGALTAAVPVAVLETLEITWTVTDSATGDILDTATAAHLFDGNAGVTLDYLTAEGASGQFTFDYWVTDDAQGASRATVTLDMAAVNDPPEAVDDVVQGIEDEVVRIDPATLLANDLDADGDVLSLVRVFDATNGTVALENGEIIFTPDVNFFGDAVFSYEVTDGTDGSDIGTARVEIEENNASPVTQTDYYTGVEDTPILITPADLLLNDSDPNPEDSISFVRILSAGDADNAFQRPDGTWQLAPNDDVNGVVTFTYQITDGRRTSNGSIKVDFAARNDAPTARDDSGFVMEEDTAITIALADLVSNDTDVEGDAFTVTGVFDGVNGTVVMEGANAIFTPRADHFGNAGFTYEVTDIHGASSQAYVSILVTPINDLPVAVRDEGLALTEDDALTFSTDTLLANDYDPDGGAVSFAGFAFDPRLSDNGDGTWTFTPAANEFGIIEIGYTITDGLGDFASGIVAFDVMGTPDAPDAVADQFDMVEDTPRTISLDDLLYNDTDIDGGAVTITGFTNLVGVNVAFDGLGGIVITPDTDYAGQGGFSYIATGSTGLSSLGQVTLDIEDVNDAPVVAPLAPYVTPEDSAVDVTLPAGAITDGDGDALTITARLADGSALPAWLSFDAATLRFSGQLPLNYNGALEIAIGVDDGTVQTTAPFVISVTPVNDAPVASTDYWDGGQTVILTIPLTHLMINDLDVDGDALEVTEVFGGTGFTAELDGNGNVVIARDPEFTGQIEVGYTLSDGALTDAGALLVDLEAVNVAPVIVNPGTVSAAEDSAIDITLPEGTVTDADGDPLSITLAREGGTALPAWLTFDPETLRLTGTPPANFNGVIALEIAASDGLLNAVEAFVLEITPVNDAPILLAPFSDRFTAEDEAFDIALQGGLFTDVDGDPLSFSVTLEDGSPLPEWIGFDPVTFALTGQPPEDFNGVVALRLHGSDGQASVSDVFDLTVTPVNDAPVLVNPLADIVSDNAHEALQTGKPFEVVLDTGAFSDPDGDALSFAAQLAGGAALPEWLLFDGQSLSGLAPRSEAGAWEIELLATDGQEITSGTFTMTLLEVNTPPVLGRISLAGTVPNALLFDATNLLNAASDFDGDVLTVVSVQDAQNGVVEMDNGVVSYLADFDFEGQDSFTYTVSDGMDEVTGSVTVTVDNPFLGDDAGRFDEVLTGTDGRDLLNGGRGDDLVSGGEGDDILLGGRGNDHVLGGAGDDLVLGGGGADTVSGGAGNDIIFGGGGGDELTGGQGDDWIFGGRGQDSFSFETGDGSDRVFGFEASRARRNSFIAGDELRLSVDGIESFDDLMAVASQQRGGVLFDFGNGDEIFLSGTRLASLDDDQFTFY